MTSYTEQTRHGPVRNGTPGGDGQLTEAWSRVFERMLTNSEHIVITVDFYAWQRNDDSPVELVRQTEYLTCTNPKDPGGSEIYCNDTYISHPIDDLAAVNWLDEEKLLNTDWMAVMDLVVACRGADDRDADATAFRACTLFDPSMLDWDGTPFDIAPGDLVAGERR